MFQQKKRKKILGSWRKEEEEVSSEHKEDMSSSIMAKYDDSEQCSDLWRCVWAMFQEIPAKKEAKIGGSRRISEEVGGVRMF